jgi:hypothetical protein
MQYERLVKVGDGYPQMDDYAKFIDGPSDADVLHPDLPAAFANTGLLENQSLSFAVLALGLRAVRAARQGMPWEEIVGPRLEGTTLEEFAEDTVELHRHFGVGEEGGPARDLDKLTKILPAILEVTKANMSGLI